MHILVIPFFLTSSAVSAPESLSVRTLGGGLGQAAVILTVRHGTSINFEGVPRTLERISIHREFDADGDLVRKEMLYPTLEFTYRESATAREAAESAVAAWNRLPVDAHYRVLEQGLLLHFVPTEVRTEDGRYLPYASLLDTPLTLDRVTGEPTVLFHDILAKLVVATGVPVEDPCAGQCLLGRKQSPEAVNESLENWLRNQEDVTLPRSSATARELLDDVMVAADYQTNWFLLWVPSNRQTPESVEGRWVLGFETATPDKERELNGTPLTP